MVRAVIDRGQICPIEPLPSNWRDGQPVRVVEADVESATIEEIDRDFATLASLCANRDLADEEQFDRALEEAHHLAKEQTRRRMGLP